MADKSADMLVWIVLENPQVESPELVEGRPPYLDPSSLTAFVQLRRDKSSFRILILLDLQLKWLEVQE